jgi:hypothetical protein
MQAREVKTRGVEKHGVGDDGAVILAARLPRRKIVPRLVRPEAQRIRVLLTRVPEGVVGKRHVIEP